MRFWGIGPPLECGSAGWRIQGSQESTTAPGYRRRPAPDAARTCGTWKIPSRSGRNDHLPVGSSAESRGGNRTAQEANGGSRKARTLSSGATTCDLATDLCLPCALVRTVWCCRSASAGTGTEQKPGSSARHVADRGDGLVLVATDLTGDPRCKRVERLRCRPRPTKVSTTTS